MFSSQRFSVRGIFALIVVSCLFTALLFTGCKPEPDEPYIDDHILNTNLYGKWKATYGDYYTIKSTTAFSYDDGDDANTYGDFNWEGTIRYVTNFNSSKTAGVIIFEYNEPQTNTDFSAKEGKFIGVYYKNFKKGVSVEMGTASLYPDSAEEDDLWKAIKAFTEGKEGTYMSMYGTYLKE